MGNYLAMQKFYKGESVESIKDKIRDMFSISQSFVNLNDDEDFIYVDESNEEEEVKYNSLFDYKFEEILNKKESKIALNELEEVFVEMSDYLQECEEAYSDFVYCEIAEENELIVSIAIIFHEI